MAMIPRGPKAADTASAAPAAPAATAAPAAPAPAPAAAPASAPAPAAAPAPATTTTALAAAPASAVSTRVSGVPVNVLKEDFEKKFQLDWNTLHRIQVNQGQFLDKENNNSSLGTVIELDIMTYQDNWQISPGSNEPGAKDVVRYSDDGETTTKGEPCAEYLQAAIEQGWPNTKMTKRVVLAGTVARCVAKPEMEGKLVQIDLSATSKTQYDRHAIQVALDVAKGLRQREACGRVKMTAKPQSRGDQNWTIAEFTYGSFE
jgi:hypothetical protein